MKKKSPRPPRKSQATVESKHQLIKAKTELRNQKIQTAILAHEKRVATYRLRIQKHLDKIARLKRKVRTPIAKEG